MAIYIATHKAAEVPAADWLVPIGLGGYSDERVRLTDSDGDNIAHLNRTHCELTATYWLWKQCQDPYIGLCHYRRLFAFQSVPIAGWQDHAIVRSPAAPQLLEFLAADAQHQRMLELLETYEVIVPRAVLEYPSIGARFRDAHGAEMWSVFTAACRDEFGSIARCLELETRFHYGNMLVARADVFMDYATRLFRVLAIVFEQLGVPDEVPGVRYQPFRYPGYLGERFTHLYLLATRARLAAVQSVWLE